MVMLIFPLEGYFLSKYYCTPKTLNSQQYTTEYGNLIIDIGIIYQVYLMFGS